MYSLWLIPEDKSFTKYSDVIEGFSKKFKTPYFEPHITLLGNIKSIDDEAMYGLSVLAAVTEKFTIQLRQLTFQNDYYRCFYLLVEQTPQLYNLYQEAQQIFENNTDKYTFMPHLSLIYHNMGANQKKKLIKKLGKSLNGKIKINRLRLVKTAGAVKDWQLVEEFPFWNKDEQVEENLAFFGY